MHCEIQLKVCLFSTPHKNYKWDLRENFLPEMYIWTRKSPLDFDANPDHFIIGLGLQLH